MTYAETVADESIRQIAVLQIDNATTGSKTEAAMPGTYAAENDVFVTIRLAYGWDGLYDVTWIGEEAGDIAYARLNQAEIADLIANGTTKIGA